RSSALIMISLQFILLSSQTSAPSPHLHSFPTRRSSDLFRGADIDLLDGDVFEPPRALPQLLRGDRLRQVQPDGLVVRIEIAVLLDRKSTRLNSSHSQSSYAVFCLKKKSAMMMNTTMGIA